MARVVPGLRRPRLGARAASGLNVLCLLAKHDLERSDSYLLSLSSKQQRAAQSAVAYLSKLHTWIHTPDNGA